MITAMNNNIFNPKRLLLGLSLLFFPLMSLTSCGNDEPDLMVGYYLSINSQVGYMATTENEEQGTMSDSNYGNVLYTTITKMRQALHNAYPIASKDGNDVAVLSACDNIYREYKSMYGALEKNTICVAKIYRARMDGEIVVSSKTLTVYHFGALPPGMDSSE